MAAPIVWWTPGETSSALSVGIRSQRLAADVAGRLVELATATGVPMTSVLLAAHARVLRTLTGETAVVTALRSDPGADLRPVRIDVPDGSWQDLLDRVRRAETAASEPTDGVDTVVADGADAPTPSPLPRGVKLQVQFHGVGADLSVHLSHRHDVLDAAQATRLVGYYVSALESLAEGLAGDHHRCKLVSDEEQAAQLTEFSGPVVELPDRRFAELFEEQVRLRPDAVAVSAGTVTLTFAELNRRANRVARALADRGLGVEDVVGVMTERDSWWMAAVIGIFKAGAVYLPIEPHFPADRIHAMTEQSGCRLLAVTVGSDRDEVVPQLPRLVLDPSALDGYADDDPGVRVGADQLAYIYFTSGSTGRPKGVMCEHAGMLNHLLAKIADLGIGPDTVVAQTAPQCFDISLWQLLAARWWVAAPPSCRRTSSWTRPGSPMRW
ncbi:non-ribosomal peptide synthetase [Micromonospora tarensis]|uniref:AMP-binding protein n=1 Tax=Micromonospora tarensis TaxID=2806100 RepID=A0ABS1YAZ4_9ACTN|nr:AMP-binding protein [Micromonospora tarensis]MBM0274411.1 AMP-binding protein [Micromonospora tarensis]